MIELTREEVFAIMQSDMKLWEKAETEVSGNDITKRLTLPMGIGEIAVQFQGVDNGLKRRSAAEQWGATIREAVKEATDDEAITARAQLAAAQKEAELQSEGVGDTDSGHGSGDEAPVGLQHQQAVPAATTGQPAKAHEADGGEDQGPPGTDFAARAEWLRGRVAETEKRLEGYRRELRAFEAAIAAFNGEDE